MLGINRKHWLAFCVMHAESERRTNERLSIEVAEAALREAKAKGAIEAFYVALARRRAWTEMLQLLEDADREWGGTLQTPQVQQILADLAFRVRRSSARADLALREGDEALRAKETARRQVYEEAIAWVSVFGEKPHEED